ncbi:MAG: glycoside hydrolase family 18 protein [Chloroflexota bacterium]|nr:glycoside hydrolase family 18 protein [Chloroflexota bacterium]
MNRRPSATGPASLSGHRIGARLAAGLLATIMLAACASSISVAPTAEPSASVPPTLPAAAASALPTVTPAPSAPPATLTGSSLPGGYDPAKFGFAAKGMSHEVMAFVTTSQVNYALDTMDWDVVSTVAFFSLEAGQGGHIRHDGRWTIWNEARVSRLIAKAHERGTRVVISLARFAWSPGQTAVARDILASAANRAQLAKEVAGEVNRRGVDGVNVDFEPIPIGQKANFTTFVRLLREQLDAIRPGYQLTFDVTGHHESYDVGGALRPGGADAVYLMGYHYAGVWSKVAGSTSPLGGPRYDVADTIRSLLRFALPKQLIVGVPYYGHTWPTATGGLHSRTVGGGHDVLFARAAAVAAAMGSRYDTVEQVRWVAFRQAGQWYQMYFDDARSMAAKWALVKAGGLLGSGVWTIAFEGRLRELDAAMRKAFIPPPAAAP